MRVTSKGQVTIPVDLREQFGLLPDTEVDFVVDGDAVKIVPAEPRRPDRGTRVIERLRGTATTRMSTDEIMELTRPAAS